MYGTHASNLKILYLFSNKFVIIFIILFLCYLLYLLVQLCLLFFLTKLRQIRSNNLTGNTEKGKKFDIYPAGVQFLEKQKNK